MKYKILTKIMLFVLLVVVLGSCSKWIDTDMNINPDAPADVPMNLILPTVQARLAFDVVGSNDVTRPQSLWIQQTTGIARQSQAEGAYSFRSGDVNNLWGNVYAGVLMDAKQLINKAVELESPHFEGVGWVLTAVTLGISTDNWGSIPWSEALLGDENLTPVFDSQESVYAAVQSCLDKGITLLSTPASANKVALSGDIIYGSNTAKWVAAAYALKARYAIHLSKRDDGAYQEALGYLNNAFTSNAGNMYYYYGSGDVNNANPLYLFMMDRGDIRMSWVVTEAMTLTSDPRLPMFATPIDADLEINGVTYPAGSYVGAPIDQPIDGASHPGPGLASSNTSTPFITYAELAFIKAEALYKTSDEPGAKQAFKDGLEASLNEYGVFDQVWLDDASLLIDALSDETLFEAIMSEKWIALMYNSEAFVDWRRTGYPELTPNPLATIQEIPRRFPYATDAITYNPNTPDLGNEPLWIKVWWDQ